MANAALIIGDVDKVYSKNKDIKKADVDRITEWINNQKHLPKMAEMQVINFLHSNNFSNEQTKKCIDLFYTTKTHCSEFFKNKNAILQVNPCIFYTQLNEKTSDGCRILYARLHDVNAEKYSFGLHIKVFDSATMIMLSKEGPSEGVHFVHDLKGVSLVHISKLNLLLLKKFFFYLQDCMPLKIRGLHFLNCGHIIEAVLKLIKPFMKKELLEVLYIHSDSESAFKVIPQKILPSDIGGDGPSCAELYDIMIKNLKENKEFLIAEELQHTDESKREGKPKKVDDLFGIEGTFKKLDID